MRTVIPTCDYAEYASAWDKIALAGNARWNFDTWASGRRYLSLAAVVLSPEELAQLRTLTRTFSRLIDRAVDGILADREWWSALAWPWAAIELARHEPPHPGGRSSLFGRFDCLLDSDGTWRVIEYNADTPSGGRETSGLEPGVARLHTGLHRTSSQLTAHLVAAIKRRIAAHRMPVRLIGVVSTHSWIEDIAQAHWLATLLRRAGLAVVVGDVNDLASQRGRITLRGHPIEALYRFYPIERLYRHAIFASLLDEAIGGRLLLLNGLRGFLAQSKASLAWLWANRRSLAVEDCHAIERHLPATLLARDPAAACWLTNSVVKHVNGREGDSVVFGATLDAAGWEARLLESGFVVQLAVSSTGVMDVEVDDVRRRLHVVQHRTACVGAFSVAGAFAGCYTRLDGPITSAKATYAATLVQPV